VMMTLVHRKWGKTRIGWRWWFSGFSMLDGVLLKVDEVLFIDGVRRLLAGGVDKLIRE
jgi:hypothetical protein